MVGVTSLLDDAGILLHMLNILGPGQHLFISAVSKAWRESYQRVASVQIAVPPPSLYSNTITVTADTTLFSTVCASVSRVKLAHECGLSFNNAMKHLIAGRVAALPVLQAAYELELELTDQVASGAAVAASVPKLQWLHAQQGRPLHEDITYHAAKSGNVDVLNWLKDRGHAFTAVTCWGAAAGAHVHILKYLRDGACGWNTYACSAAAKAGHLTTLQWLHEQGCPWEPDEICGDAAESSSIEMLLYLMQQGCVLNERTLLKAAAQGKLAVCQFLLAEQCPCNAEACTDAAAGGHLETVRVMHESGCPWDVDTICSSAASSGSQELLQYLKAQGCAFVEGDMNAAAYAGHVHICAYLRAEQCPWSASACEHAACGGQLDALRWLHEQGCPWNIQAVRMAAAVSDCVTVLQYMQGFEPAASAAQLTELLNAAGVHSRPFVAKWLRQQGAEWRAKLRFQRNSWAFGLVKWARDNGCSSST
jgi:hypothetical protein